MTDANATILNSSPLSDKYIIAMGLESVFSALAGWIILKQTLTPLELCGCALMFAAIVLSQI